MRLEKFKSAIDAAMANGATTEQMAPVTMLYKELVDGDAAMLAANSSNKQAMMSQVPDVPGPGTELKKIFKTLGVPYCQACNDLAKKMNDWGVEGCKAHRAEIIADIESRAMKFNIMEWTKLGIKLAAAGLPLSIAGLVDEAIRRVDLADNYEGQS